MKKTFNLVEDGKANIDEAKRLNKVLDEDKKRRYLVIRTSQIGEFIIKGIGKYIYAIVIGIPASLIVGYIIMKYFK